MVQGGRKARRSMGSEDRRVRRNRPPVHRGADHRGRLHRGAGLRRGPIRSPRALGMVGCLAGISHRRIAGPAPGSWRRRRRAQGRSRSRFRNCCAGSSVPPSAEWSASRVAVPTGVRASRPRSGSPSAGIVLSASHVSRAADRVTSSEDLFAMAGLSTRPLGSGASYDDANGFLVDSSAVMDAQLLPLCSFRSVPRRPVGAPVRARRAAGDGRCRRRTRSARAARARDARRAAPRGAEPGVHHRRRSPRVARGRRQAGRAGAPAPTATAHQRRQPGPGRRGAGSGDGHSEAGGGRSRAAGVSPARPSRLPSTAPAATPARAWDSSRTARWWW